MAHHRIAAAFLSCASILLLACPLFAADRGGGYAGVEFLGSSLISRPEIDRALRLRPGASYENTIKAVDRLKLELDKKLVKANVDIIPAGAEFFVSVDVIDTGLAALPNRHLEDPHHIGLPNEKPFVVLEELRTRLQKLDAEGRTASESYQNGFKIYSDFACTRIGERLSHELEGQSPYLFRILASDPNNERRAAVVEMLNWAVDPVKNCQALIPALDDSDAGVRMGAAKYIWARVGLLPDNFPFDALLEGLSRQLSRPSHHDRIRAMAALAALAKRDSDNITAIKTFDEARLKEIAGCSVIPSVQELARQLLAVCANPPALKKIRKQSPSDPGSGF